VYLPAEALAEYDPGAFESAIIWSAVFWPGNAEKHMSESSSGTPLLNWLIKRFDQQELAPSRRSLEEMSDVAERLVRLYLGQCQPLRPAAVAKKLRTLSNNLDRAAKAAIELGEQGMSQVLLASGCNNPLEWDEHIRIIANLQNWALWSTRAAETAKLMNLSAGDHKGGHTPDVRLRSLVTLLMNQYEFLLGVKASHVVDPDTGLGHSTFDLFVKKAIGLYAPEDTNFKPHRIDDAIRFALPSRSSSFRAKAIPK
jgi:hypothetical protein